MSCKLEPAETPGRPARFLRAAVLIAAILWPAGFFFYFNSFTLPNSTPSTSRHDLWLQLPDNLLKSVESGGDPQAIPSSWSNLAQRVDLIIVAAVILAGAWAAGRLALRLLTLHHIGHWSERTCFAFGLGLSALSLLTLALGLAGQLDRTLFAGVIAAAVIAEGSLTLWRLVRERSPAFPKSRASSTPRALIFSSGFVLASACLAVLVPFLLAMALGAMLPSADFDVKEYHLQGPKEYFQAGRITWLPHNVYTSFPFLTEMLSLLGMVLCGDWYRGALAGKLVLMSFAPLTALGLYAAGRRWFSPAAGLLAATVHLSTPWVYRISIIAYAEGGLAFYLFAALLAVMIAMQSSSEDFLRRRYILLGGLLAGSAMACKYPGVLQVVIPLGLAVLAAPFIGASRAERPFRSAAKLGAIYTLGVLLTVGGWLAKNTAETGNPVYPLLYSVFGGSDWDTDLNTRWTAAHSTPPDRYTLADLGTNLIDVTAKSDWLSPLLFGLAPLAFLAARHRRIVGALWLYLLFLFFGWWLFTHRIDRFWVPMIPVVSLLAGIGLTWHPGIVWRSAAGLVVAAGVLFNLAFITTEHCGFNAYLADLDDAARIAAGTAPGIDYMNRNLPPGAKVLCVGEAQVFDARFPLVYNTVFDRSVFAEWCAGEESGGLREPTAILETFRAAGITHVFVNWREILRYRRPGSYGYDELAVPETFGQLQQQGVLQPPTYLDSVSLEHLTETDRREIRAWGAELIHDRGNGPVVVTMQLYEVAGVQSRSIPPLDGT